MAPALMVTVALLLVATAGALETSKSFSVNATGNKTGVELHSDGFLGYYESKFAFSATGVLSGTIKATSRNTDVSECLRLIFCDVTRRVSRDSSYQMKRISIGSEASWRARFAEDHCPGDERNEGNERNESNDDDPQCISQPVDNKLRKYSPTPDERQIVFLDLVLCNGCVRNQTGNSRATVNIVSDLSMLNVGAQFPQLGWDELAYPLAPTVILALATAIFVSVLLAFAVTWYRGKRAPYVAKVVFVTAAMKILSSGLTTGAFWRTALTGKIKLWFFIVRVPLIILDEILIGLLMLVMSTGVGLMPSSWMFDRRSSTFAVFLGLALEVFTVVTSEVLFMFRFLGLIVFLFSGGTVAFICVLYSWRNVRFLEKYAKLVHLANINVESTPLLRMTLFFQVNSALVVLVWLFKVITFGVMDHQLIRADVLWTCFEAADIVLLAWYAFSVFPRRKSAYYVDMSNVDNERLRDVNAWHVRHRAQLEHSDSQDAAENDNVSIDVATSAMPRDSTAASQANSRTGAADDDPEPPMIDWESGVMLPVPTTAMWNMQDEVRRVLKRQRPPELPDTFVRVLGSPRGSLESLSLTIAKPVIGPDAQKRPSTAAQRVSVASSFDAVQRSSADRELIGPPMERNFSDRARPTGSESGEIGALESHSAYSDFDYEPFSIPSSSASADGEIFPGDQTKMRRR